MQSMFAVGRGMLIKHSESNNMMDERTKKIECVTLWGAACNIALTVVKFIAGILGGSAAMIADAVHSLSDLISDFIVLVFARISAKGEDEGHDYGHGKFETLATVIVSMLLLAVGIEMIISSCRQIIHAMDGETLAAPEAIALWAAVISILTKELLYQWTARVGRQVNSTVVVANAWHHRTDALSSIGSLLGIGGAMLLGGRWTILDPLAGAVISLVIIIVALRMARPALAELTDASLPEDTETKIADIARSVDGVRDVHAMKSRQSGPVAIVEFHIVVDPQMTVVRAHAITVEIEHRLHHTFGHTMQVMIHIEPSEDAL